MSKVRKLYGELYYQHAPSLGTIIKNAFLDKALLRKQEAGPQVFVAPVPPNGMDTFTFAVVVDGVVEDIIQVNSHLANLFSQEHSMVEFHPKVTQVARGDSFTKGKFSK